MLDGGFSVIKMPGDVAPQHIDGFVPLVDLAELEDGEMEPFSLRGRAIVVARVGSDIYAFDESCTHKRCSLVEGNIEEGLVACPCHGAEFGLETGEVLVGPATTPLPVHQTQVNDGKVMVRLASTPPVDGTL